MSELTQELAEAFMVQVSLVPKKYPMRWNETTMDGRGNAVVILHTRATTTAIQSWFRKAGLSVSRFNVGVDDTSRKTVTFRPLPVVEGQG